MITASARSVVTKLIMLPVLLLVVSCGGSKLPQQVNVTPKVPVYEIKYQNIPVIKEFIGNTAAYRTIDIKARVEGYLIESPFKEGSIVKKGELLYMIEQQPYVADVDYAQGQLAESIATLKFQIIEYARRKILYEKRVVSKEQFDQYTEEMKQAQAEVESNKANLTKAKVNLSYTKMYAPLTGKISQYNVDVGNLVGGTQQTLLSTIIQLNPIYVMFSPSVDDYLTIVKAAKNRNTKVTITVPQHKDLTFSGRIDYSNNTASVGTSTVLLRAIVDNPDFILLPGIYVNVKVQLDVNPKTILIPQKATYILQAQNFVYVLTKNNTAKEQMVTISGTYEDQYIVSSGLKPGDKIITSGLQKIKGGEKVIPLNNSTKQTNINNKSNDTSNNKQQSGSNNKNNNNNDTTSNSNDNENKTNDNNKQQ